MAGRPTQVVTGSSGFVGGALVEAMRRRGLPVAAPHRGDLWALAAGASPDELDVALRDATVFHLAAIAHRGDGSTHPATAVYDAVNRDLPIAVARAARERGASRFVFLSTAKVLGDVAPEPLDEDAPLAPTDAYSLAKARAEEALLAVHEPGVFDVVVLRPPLVYGPRVKANFLRLAGLAASGWPLPFGRVQAQRSFVYLDNLIDALLHVGGHPAAGGQVFHVTDGQDLTVAEVVRVLADSLHAPCRMLPVPIGLLRLAGRLAGRGAQVDRLVLPFRLDSGKLRRLLAWTPPVSADAGLRATAAWWLEAGAHPGGKMRTS